MMRRIRYLFSVRPSRAADTAWGICRKDITQPRMLDTPMRKTTMPLILALSTTMAQKDLQVMFR